MSLIGAKQEHVKFVSYTGKYPNLCSGILTLEIDGVVQRFGHNYSDRFWETDGNHPTFWGTGGECGFAGPNYTNPYVHKGEWRIDASEMPEEFRKYAAEIDEVFNENIEYGCCGGCI